MSKQLIMSTIVSRLASMGIQCSTGGSADILVNHEFLSAGWSTGKKKISYQASAFLNEEDTTIYLWELTTESGSGFSFGGSGESSFQSGKTLFRKVKSIQYGIDGKAFEIEIDLGAITKLFKDTAQQYGWHFKTVLKKGKASYPDSMVFKAAEQPSQPQPAQQKTVQSPPLQQQPSQQQSTQEHTQQQPVQQPIIQQQPGQETMQEPAQFTQSAKEQNSGQPTRLSTENNKKKIRASSKKGGISGVLFYIAFFILALLTLVFMAFGKNSAIGWAIAAVVLAVYFFLGKSLTAKGCLLQIILVVITTAVLLLNFTLTSP
jgi:hypothetical protein